MSFMRYGPETPYVYPAVDGGLCISSADGEVEIPMERAEELAAMIWFRIEPGRRQEVLERTMSNHYGNFGCDGVARELGYPTAVEALKQAMTQTKTDRGDDA